MLAKHCAQTSVVAFNNVVSSVKQAHDDDVSFYNSTASTWTLAHGAQNHLLSLTKHIFPKHEAFIAGKSYLRVQTVYYVFDVTFFLWLHDKLHCSVPRTGCNQA